MQFLTKQKSSWSYFIFCSPTTHHRVLYSTPKEEKQDIGQIFPSPPPCSINGRIGKKYVPPHKKSVAPVSVFCTAETGIPL